MKIKHIVTGSLAAALVVVPTLGIAISGTQDTDPVTSEIRSSAAAQIQNKDEIVYANLSALGAVDAVYVVNHFEIAREGSIVDYGDYDKVINLTNTGKLEQSGDAVSFEGDEENYYYQGNLKESKLPWDFAFSYKLDGKSISPDELAGKSGKLEIGVTSSRNESIDPVFYEHYMLQISLSLNTDKCSNIQAEGATEASAGSDKMLSFTVLPNSDADYTVSADVTDFTMSGAEISAIPYSMDIGLDVDDSLSELEQLPAAISQLNDGVAALKSGTAELKSGAGSLSGGSSGIKSGLHQLSTNGESLAAASAQIDRALAQIAAALNSGGEVDLSSLQNLPGALDQMADGLDDISAGLATLDTNFSAAYSALDTAIENIQYDSGSINWSAVETAIGDSATYNEIKGNYDAAQTVKATYDSTKSSFVAVDNTLPGLISNLNNISGSLRSTSSGLSGALQNMQGLDGLSELTGGMNELSGSYSVFHQGLLSYTGGMKEVDRGYSSFHSGITAFGQGVGELDSGASQLHDGTSTLNAELANLPEMIQEEIDNMTQEFMPGDFAPVSFSSEKNDDTGFVQFVMMCEGIEKPEEEKEAPEQEEEKSVWDRLKALFQ